MSNLARLYTEHTKLPAEASQGRVKEEETKEQQAQADAISKLHWLQHPATKEFREKLIAEVNDLVDKSINLAVSYPTTKNHEQIVQNLVRVDTLRRQLNYGRPD